MNSDMLLNRIRMAQQGLIGVHKKLYTLEHLLPSPDPAQFAETAKSAALLSERSTASLRGFLFTTTGGMPEGYYQQAAAAQGIKVSATDDYVFIRVPALLPKKKAAEGFKFLVVPLQAAFEEYRRQHALPHFSDCVICIEHIYDRCLPITAVRDYDNLEFKSILDVIALYCIPDRATQERINAAGVEAYHAAVEQLVARAQAVRPAPIKEQMAEAAKQAGKENAARPAPAKAKEARNDR